MYGDASPRMQSICGERRLPLHVFAWHRGMASRSLERNAFYLIRPDGYVGLAGRQDDTVALQSYLNSRQLAVRLR